MKENKYDFFICHASDDKESFVKPLVNTLIAKGFKVWYDELSLEMGDSLVQGISEGIKNSMYAVIVLSKSFFLKEWTKKELAALINKEIITKENVILPIWLEVSLEDVYNFSPLLVDKVGILVRRNELSKAVEAIERKLGITFTTKKQAIEKITVLTSYNDDKRNKYLLDLEYRIKNIYYFLEDFSNWFNDYDDTEDEEWNEINLEIKRKQLQNEYSIPNGVWLQSDVDAMSKLESVIEMCRKWVYIEMQYEDALELYFLLHEFLDTDFYYVMYGFPFYSIRTEELEFILLNGFLRVGVKKYTFDEDFNTKYEKLEPKMFVKYFT